MKRIVILCDGTWSRADSRTPTNVVRLARALRGRDDGGTVQVPVYVPGVGTGEGVSRTARLLDRAMGGAFGWGLTENMVDAYRHLAFLYEPGDEIHLFGFSRGAFTARSLAGFVRSTGIVGRDDLSLLPHAVARYRTRGREETKPSTDESHAFRSDAMRSRVATSAAEVAWRAETGRGDAPLLQVAYMGVWDTVGALGVPHRVPVLGALAARRYQFHDADLSSMVAAARHAVAVDERRASFEPTLWENLDQLHPGPNSPYRQMFFAGDHGAIGGGGTETALSSIALRWVVEGAQAAGLSFDAARLGAIRAEEDPFGPLRNEPAGGIGDWLLHRGAVDRQGPPRIDGLHDTTVARLTKQAKHAGEAPYRPPGLRHLEAEIARLMEEGDRAVRAVA